MKKLPEIWNGMNIFKKIFAGVVALILVSALIQAAFG